MHCQTNGGVHTAIDDHQSLLISSNSNEANMDILSDASEEYLLDRKRAGRILHQVTHSQREWEAIAKRLQIPEQEISPYGLIYVVVNKFLQYGKGHEIDQFVSNEKLSNIVRRYTCLLPLNSY
ncbi:MAG: hypothetical protein GX102_02100 [Porphyromonadaceae bacterium]|nr:hypothetical protein [Porphyromonadaceae bacterium]